MDSKFSITLSDLPYDIKINVCSFLPIKSIGQFRCVSKSWRDFLSNPDFIKTQIASSRNSSVKSIYIIACRPIDILTNYVTLIHVIDQVTPSVKSFTSSIGTLPWTRLSTCYTFDGLLLATDYHNSRKLILLNPITQEIRELPHWPSAPKRTKFGCFPHGIGYDSCQDDYKVVLLLLNFYTLGNPMDCEAFVRIYSTNNGTWKECVTSPGDIGLVIVSPGYWPFLNRCMHYLAKRKSDNTNVIAAFNIEEERFYEVPLHSSLSHKDISSLFLREVGGCICVCSNQGDIWMMKEYGVEKSWVKLVSFDTKGVKFMPLCLLGHDNLILSKFVKNGASEELVTYNMKDKTFKDVVVKGEMCDYRKFISFKETMVSPYGNL